jgi:predicted PurR-regulated permease PerM
MTTPASSGSPQWGSTTKLVVALTMIAIVALMIVQFRSIIGPLILAFMLSYLLHPVAIRVSNRFHLSWKVTVGSLYLLLVVVLGGIFTLTGLAIAQQIAGLVTLVQTFLTDLPNIVADLSSQTFQLGPFQFSLAQYDLPTLAEQALATIRPLVGQVGALLTTFASGAAQIIWKTVLVILVSYFLLNDAGRLSGEFFNVNVPGYNKDLRRLGTQLGVTWNAFLRGQLLIILMVMGVYAILMLVLGVRYALVIALLAGLARLVPYVGSFIAWTTTALVAYFQGSNYLGLSPVAYTIVVVGLALLVDQIFDNLISPRIFGTTLGVHPAAVLVGAIVATSWLGIVGLFLAAPVLASAMVLSRYILRKMFDLDPFPEVEPPPPKMIQPMTRYTRRLLAWWRMIHRE